MNIGNFVDLSLAVKSLHYLKKVLQYYGYATVDDAIDILCTGLRQRASDGRGWTDLSKAWVLYDCRMKVWRIRLPEPVELYGLPNIVIHK